MHVATPTKKIEDVFQKINREHVAIKSNERKLNNSLLFEVLGEILNMMEKYDPLFSNMDPKLDYLGSYFDGLRVGQPTEYDLNIILTLPMNYDKIILDATKTKHDYVSVVMSAEFRRLCKIPNMAENGFSKTELWCDKQHRLSVTKFRSWMQSVVDGALNKLELREGQRILEVNGKVFQITAKLSGPANTLTVINDDTLIDVDLVPTFAFQTPKKPHPSRIRYDKLEQTNIKHYFVVPKPSEDCFSWRLTFPIQERKYMDNKYNLKSTVKLLKLLRDVQGFKKLSSYFIKTIFLWEIENGEDSFWKKNSLSFLVLYMMKKLSVCLEKAEIPNFWCPTNNLLDKVNSVTCYAWGNRLKNIIKDIEKNKKNNPYILLKYFTEKKVDRK